MLSKRDQSLHLQRVNRRQKDKRRPVSICVLEEEEGVRRKLGREGGWTQKSKAGRTGLIEKVTLNPDLNRARVGL